MNRMIQRRLQTATFVMLAAALAPNSAHAAASTTCLCRSEDGKSFVESTHRHSRWACDVKLGYLPATEKSEAPAKPRPGTQTCNAEEIVQYKVWACIERGCTYQYARGMPQKNKALERIAPLQGERKP
jgi:hypothetical protein